MNQSDDRLRRAFDEPTDDVAVDPSVLDDVMHRGRQRRRAKLTALSLSAAAVIAVAGAVVVTSLRSDDPGAIATDPGPAPTDPSVPTGPSPSTTAATIAPAPTTLDATSAGPNTTAPTTSTTSASTTGASTTGASTTTTTVPPPIANDPRVTPLVGRSTLTIDGVDLEFGWTGQLPDADESFVVAAGSYEAPVLEVWSPSGRAASLESVGCGGDGCRISTAAYDSTSFWFVVDRWSDLFLTEQATLVRGDLASGGLTAAYSAPPRHALPSVQRLADGRVFALQVGPPDDPGRTATVLDLTAGQPAVVTTFDAPSTSGEFPPEGVVNSAVFDPAGSRVAAAFGDGVGRTATIHVVDLDRGDVKTVQSDLDTERFTFVTDVDAWVGDLLLVSDRWEDGYLAVLDPNEPTAAFVELGGVSTFESACVFADGTLVRATWDLPYAPEDTATGTVVRVTASGDLVADYGVDIISDGIACLSGGRVAVAEWTITDDPHDPAVPRRLSVITPDPGGGSTVDVLAEGPYGVVAG